VKQEILPNPLDLARKKAERPLGHGHSQGENEKGSTELGTGDNKKILAPDRRLPVLSFFQDRCILTANRDARTFPIDPLPMEQHLEIQERFSPLCDLRPQTGTTT
jgi:hypothetical protein